MNNKPNLPRWVRHTSFSMTLIFLYVHVIYGALEPVQNLWQQRKTAPHKLTHRSQTSNFNDSKDLFSNTKVTPPSKETALLSQLPALEPHLLSNSIPKSQEFYPDLS